MIASVQPKTMQQQVPQPVPVLVTYDPSRGPDNPFSFSTDQLALAVDSSADTVIELTLASAVTDAVFSAAPITWVVAPPNAQQPMRDNTDQRTFRFEVRPPEHFFKPWVFRVNVDADPIFGITSANFFLVLSTNAGAGQNVTLVYDSSNGSFMLDQTLDLLQEFVLVNTVAPLTVTITCVDPQNNPVSFANPPISWSNGSQPTWVLPNPVVSGGSAGNILTLQITNAAPGQSAGFKLIILGPNSTAVASPDPILINATLGDGT